MVSGLGFSIPAQSVDLVVPIAMEKKRIYTIKSSIVLVIKDSLFRNPFPHDRLAPETGKRIGLSRRRAGTALPAAGLHHHRWLALCMASPFDPKNPERLGFKEVCPDEENITWKWIGDADPYLRPHVD
jgi:hypothetical protein